MKFTDTGLSEDVLRAVADAGYVEPTPIQEQAISVVLMGRDILGCAQTGTGKTASFTLPMIDILASGKAKARMPRSLILEPTRELAAQVADNFGVYGKYHKLSMALLIGGVSMADQIAVIERGPDVLIATPGRLLDLFERGQLLLNDVRILVIDEADRMLDMGFIPDVERIVSLVPKLRQTLFFSATMPPEIRRLADVFLMNPKEISASPPSTIAVTVGEGIVMVTHGDGKRPGGGQKEKREVLRRLIVQENVKNALIFCNRKRDVSVLCRSLVRHGFNATQLHGDMAQSSRMEVLNNFKEGKFAFLVCSDVASRGLDIPNMSHVFNFDVPTHPEDYIHRIGRTGRAGKKGRALTIATAEDGKHLDAIAKLTRRPIPRLDVEAGNLAEAGLAGARAASPGKAASQPSQENVRKRERQPNRHRERHQPAKSQAEPAKATASKPNQRPVKRPINSHNNESDNAAGNKPVVGMGDHMPAFLLHPARPKD